MVYLYTCVQVGMDELENQTIRQWRDSEKSVTTLKSTLVQIDPEQRCVCMCLRERERERERESVYTSPTVSTMR